MAALNKTHLRGQEQAAAHLISESRDGGWISMLSINLTFPNHAATQITAGQSILSTGVRLSCSTICVHNTVPFHV
jgi:hypothetical protein